MTLRPNLCFAGFIVVASCSSLLFAQVSPFDFVQRSDVGREINIQPTQLELVQRLQPVCDTQCQARVMDMLTSVSTELQTQFLAQLHESQQQTVQSLDQTARESVESTMLSEAVLTPEQMSRFEQLRTQFLGIDSFLTDRVSQLTGMSPIQINQLNEIQNVGSELINSCQQNAGLSTDQRQGQIQNIQNVLIDQSVNILNDAQIEIFVNLCGDKCNFDPTPEPGSPSNDQTDNQTNAEIEDSPAGAEPESIEANPGSSGSETRSRPVQQQATGSATRNVPRQNGSGTRNQPNQ